MIKKYIVAIALASCGVLTSCLDLDIAPMNIVQDKDIFSSENGIKSYLARMYSQLPVEDFRYSGAANRGFNHFWIIDPIPNTTGEAIGNNNSAAKKEEFDYYEDGYKLIRDVDYFLETLPTYAGKYSETQVNTWLGEAYFTRGVTYFALAKRYGGVPLTNKVLNYPDQSIDELKIPRSSEEAVYDQVYSDLIEAWKLLPEESQTGRANKYAAAAFNSRAMVFAGSSATYNKVVHFDDKNTRLCGIPAEKAKDYYKKSYDEAVKLEGHYDLYKNSWKAGDKAAQYQNYIDLFFDKSSTENIFVKEYGYPNSVHGFDAYYVPRQLMGPNGYAAACSPTLNFVEMFDGLDKNAQGKIETFDVNGHYKMFDNTMDFFVNAEPRLRATVILPGDEFKGEQIEIWRGIYTKQDVADGITRLLPEGTVGFYESNPECKKYIVSSSDPNGQRPYTLPNGKEMNPCGRSGAFASGRDGAMAGFSVRKWLDPKRATADVLENHSDQTWIEMRYAEVLLNRAEAAYQLYLLGEAATYLTDAYTCINDIRERAGADMLTAETELNDIKIIQTERRKELAFENKTWWDLRRWRILDKEQNATHYRTLMPFYAAYAGKYFFDAKIDELNRSYTFNTSWYYQNIPGGAIEKNPTLKQNPGY